MTDIESVADDCASCGEVDSAEDQCPRAQRACGHHCNCVWIHDECSWCGKTFGPDDEPSVPATPE